MKIITYIPNWVGDAVMTLPALHALQKAGFELEVFGRPWAKDLFSACHFPVHALTGKKSQFSKLFRQYRGEYGISFRSSFSSAWAMCWGGVKTLGYHADGRWFLLHKGFQKPEMIQHRVLTTWELAKKSAEFLGVSNFPEIVAHDYLPVGAAQTVEAEKVLSLHGVAKPYWVVCPFATGNSPTGDVKLWPFWKTFCEALKARNIAVVICPSREEEISATETAFPHAYILKNIRLDVYSAILKNAEQVVANDTGPMHIAAAVGAPVLGIFGVSDPRLTYPWGGDYLGGPTVGWPSVHDVFQKLSRMSQ